MKQFILLFICFFIITSCTSTRIITTHEEVMKSYDTKEKIINKFGLPVSKVTEGEFEQWYYDYGSVSRSSTSTTYSKPIVNSNSSNNFNVSASSNSGINWNLMSQTVAPKLNLTTSYGSTVTNTKNRYVKFLIKGDDVVSWDSQLVDFSQKVTENDAKKTALAVMLVCPPCGIIMYVTTPKSK